MALIEDLRAITFEAADVADSTNMPLAQLQAAQDRIINNCIELKQQLVELEKYVAAGARLTSLEAETAEF